jgi:hypothetical protein
LLNSLLAYYLFEYLVDVSVFKGERMSFAINRKSKSVAKLIKHDDWVTLNGVKTIKLNSFKKDWVECDTIEGAESALEETLLRENEAALTLEKKLKEDSAQRSKEHARKRESDAYRYVKYRYFLKETAFFDVKMVNKALFGVTANKRFIRLFYSVSKDKYFIDNITVAQMDEVIDMLRKNA